MDYNTYRKETLERLSPFEIAFRPHKKWQDVKLSELCPCYTCKVHKEIIARQYEIQMSGGLDEELSKPCKHCSMHMLWETECLEKLYWYEKNDERLKCNND